MQAKDTEVNHIRSYTHHLGFEQKRPLWQTNECFFVLLGTKMNLNQ